MPKYAYVEILDDGYCETVIISLLKCLERGLIEACNLDLWYDYNLVLVRSSGDAVDLNQCSKIQNSIVNVIPIPEHHIERMQAVLDTLCPRATNTVASWYRRLLQLLAVAREDAIVKRLLSAKQ